MLAHGWANLGDHAITLATRALMMRAFPDRPSYVFTRQQLAANWGAFRASVRDSDVLAIPGGGNMGDLYPHEEQARLAVVSAFPNNRIVSFPQSTLFDSKSAILESAAVYHAHRNLTMMFRDHTSHDFARRYLHDDSIAVPDIVFSSAFPYPFQAATGETAVIQRDDAEKLDASSALFDRVRSQRTTREMSTIAEPTTLLSPSDAGAKVYALVDALRASGGLVTDRLHGVILGIQAGVPVVAADNSYGKIRGALELAYGDRYSEVVNMEGDLSFLDSAPRATDRSRSPFFDTFERLRPILNRPKR